MPRCGEDRRLLNNICGDLVISTEICGVLRPPDVPQARHPDPPDPPKPTPYIPPEPPPSGLVRWGGMGVRVGVRVGVGVLCGVVWVCGGGGGEGRRGVYCVR